MKKIILESQYTLNIPPKPPNPNNKFQFIRGILKYLIHEIINKINETSDSSDDSTQIFPYENEDTNILINISKFNNLSSAKIRKVLSTSKTISIPSNN